MAALSDRDLLDLWEQADGLTPARRALVLAAVGGADGPVESDVVARLPVGARDARLLELRRDIAGPLLEAVAQCPSCNEEVELAIDADVLLQMDAAFDGSTTTEVDGLAVTWRCPTAGDVDAIATLPPERAEVELWRRCVLEVRQLGERGVDEVDGGDHPAGLPSVVRTAVAEAMAAADPLSEVVLDVVCAGCGGSFPAEIDVATFAWAELAAAAQRVLREVDVLARTYGWTEPDVLALTDARRARYLALALGDA
jgi:hypothetical protein